ncbi:MAG: hypothetical protein KDE51_25575 [Anaerolineales bacterium]|nr:hypothetical protein [Anaerolineales bacterium]
MDKAVEIMRIVRIPPVGKLVVEIQGKRFFSLAEISDPKARQMVLAALGELVVFAGGYQEIVDAGFAPPLANPPSLDQLHNTSATKVQSSESSLEDQQNAFLESLERGGTGIGVPANDSGGRPSLFRRRARPQQSEEPLLPKLNIVGELNQILQKHLANDPELRNHTIKLENGLHGGVRINVDGKYYEDVAQVPDPMIRMAFKLATREWEDAQSQRPLE